VTAPASMSSIQRSPGKPAIKTTADGIRVKHSCLVNKITTSATPQTFQTQYTIVNPGLTQGTGSVDLGAFSWLPAIARNFQRYKIHKLRFRYQPICGTATAGTMAMAMVHETKDTVPTTLTQLLNFASASCGPLWAPQDTLESSTALGSQARNGRLVRQTTIPANESFLDFDYGYLVMATDNALASTVAGLVWADVDIEFFLPVQ
jgi:hypothetical protein